MYEQIEKTKEKSRVVANSISQKKSNVKQGFGFVDNRIETKRKTLLTKELSNSNKEKSSTSTTIQGRFYPPIPEQGIEWNAVLDKIDTLHGNTPLPNKADIDNFILQSEDNWYGDGDHADNVARFNAFITLKGKVKTGLEQLKLDPNDSAALNWGDIVGYLTNDVGGKRFIVVNASHGHLGGGHGNGWFWNAVGVTTGTVPDATHGLGDGALNGARGSVRTVINAHNTLIDIEKANW